MPWRPPGALNWDAVTSPAFNVSGVCQWLKIQLGRRYGKSAEIARRRQESGDFLLEMEIDGLGTLDFYIAGELASSLTARELTQRLEEAEVLPRFMASYYEPLILTPDGLKTLREAG